MNQANHPLITTTQRKYMVVQLIIKLPLSDDRAVQAAADVTGEVFTMLFWNEIRVEITKVTRYSKL